MQLHLVFLNIEGTLPMQRKLSTLQEVQEQYAWFKRMRDTQPVWLDESSGCWHVFRFTDVNTVTTDYHLFSSERQQGIQQESSNNSDTTQVTTEAQDGRKRGMKPTLLGMDPPQHRQYRNLVSPSFTPRALSRLSGRITAITQELLDEVRPTGHMDFVTDFAYPLPTIVIAEMLGIPTSDRPLFKQWADGLLNFQLSDAEVVKPEQRSQNNPEIQRMNRLFEEMYDYFEVILEERRKQPREDMMSELLAAEIDGERLSMDDQISFCILLLLAGHVTTTNLLGQAIRCLSEHPDALAQLRLQPDLIPGAIEEVLRYASPVWRILRTTKTDVTIEGVTIPAHSLVFSWLASANRDERQFSEPERFDIRRTPNHHLAFGHGIHFCIGAPLSRLEASIALPMLIEQLPDLQVVSDHPLELYRGSILFGFKHMPVTFNVSAPAGEKTLSF
jgi:cytochrome P450